MNKAQAIGIAVGVTVGMLGVAVGVALAREEGRAAARRWLAQSGDLAQKGQQRALEMSQQARQVAADKAPQVRDRISTMVSPASQKTADALNAALARAGLNGTSESSVEA